MQFNRFGRTGLHVSRLCLGTATFGKQSDEETSCAILDRVAEAGVNFLDTADVYPMGADASRLGLAEEIVGRWLKGKRARFIVATKGGAPMGPSPCDQGTSRRHLLDAIDGSLRRLGTDFVDIYQLHYDDPSTPIDESLEALDAIVRSGKARYVGISNVLAYRLARALGRSDVLRLARFASVQPRYNLLFREIERELLPLAREEGLAVLPFNPLAGGLLTGKYRRDANPDRGRFSADVGPFGVMYQQRYWHEREFETIDALRAIADRLGHPLTKVAIAWVLANPVVTSVILGASRVEQLDDTLSAVDLGLSSDTKASLDEATAHFRRGDAAR